MNKWKATVAVLLVVVVAQFWMSRPNPVQASNNEQAIGETPIELYLLLNQPGPLWMYGINLSRAELRLIDLRGATLSYANLEKADLFYADLSEANLSFANLANADLDRADLERAFLYWAKLDDAILTDTDLRKADLSGASLLRADLTGADLKGATYDEDTAWPRGFDPEKEGAIFQPSGQVDDDPQS